MVFFPAYPLISRPLAAIFGTYPSGFVVSAAAGIGAIALFARWCRDRMGSPETWIAVGLFALYPYSLFLFGAVYADSLFLLAGLASFVLLESKRPWLAGVAGALATAARPMGVVLVVGLLLRSRELAPESPTGTKRWLGRDQLAVMTSTAGIGAFAVYLWIRFGDPLAMIHGQEGWHQQAGPATWFKVQFFKDVTDFASPRAWLLFMAHPVLTVVGLAFVPLVWRRFGRSYGLYVGLLLGLSALSTKNFFGMARYLLAAFPVFAAAGEQLARRRVPVRAGVLAASGLGLGFLTACFSRGYYLS